MTLCLSDLDIKIIEKKNYPHKRMKFIYQGNVYFYKEEKTLRDIYNEIIAEKIANRLNIPCCHYTFVEYEGDYGVISRSFEDTNYISMADYLKKHYNDSHHVNRNTLEDIWFAFSKDFNSETTENLMNQLVKIFLFDVLIGNIDRHTENYGLIITEDDVNIAPIFDNEQMLSDYSIYDGDYSLGIESCDENSYGEVENYFYKFLSMSDSLYQTELLRIKDVISEESLEEIFKEMEEDININPSIKTNVLKRFKANRIMINNYFENEQIREITLSRK